MRKVKRFFDNGKSKSKLLVSLAITAAIVIGLLLVFLWPSSPPVFKPDIAVQPSPSSGSTVYVVSETVKLNASIELETGERVPVTLVRLLVSGAQPLDVTIPFTPGTYSPSNNLSVVVTQETGTTGSVEFGYAPTKKSFIRFGISWRPTAAGDYTAKLEVTADDAILVSQPASFSLILPSTPAPTIPIAPLTSTPTGTTPASQVEVLLPVSPGAEVQAVTTGASADGRVTVTVPRGTVAKTAEGQPLAKVTIAPAVGLPPAPADQRVVGIPYNLGPTGATFAQPVLVSIRVAAGDVPPGIDPQGLVVARYDAATGQWVQLKNISVIFNQATGIYTVTGEADHFTLFAVLTRATSPLPVSTPVRISTPEPAPTPVEQSTSILFIGVVVVVSLVLYLFWRLRR